MCSSRKDDAAMTTATIDGDSSPPDVKDDF